MLFCQKTVLQSVVACKGSDNLWLELFTKEVHTSVMFFQQLMIYTALIMYT